jgi:hypothetical protein
MYWRVAPEIQPYQEKLHMDETRHRKIPHVSLRRQIGILESFIGVLGAN